MRLYIKAEYMAAIMLFRTGGSAKAEKRREEKETYNRSIATQVYYHVKNGGSAYQTANKGHRLIIYHQSTREPGAIQISYFGNFGGKWEATSHATAYSPDKVYKNFLLGQYINLKK